MKIGTEVMALLSAAHTEGNKLFITGGQLDRGLYARSRPPAPWSTPASRSSRL